MYSGRDLEFAWKNVVELIFRDGSGVRARGGRLTVEPSAVQELSPPFREVAAVDSVLQTVGPYVAIRIAPLPEEAMDELRAVGHRMSGRELADVNLQYHIYVDNESPDRLARVLNELNANALPIVEIAFPRMMQGAGDSVAQKRGADLLPWPSQADIERSEAVSTNGRSYLPRRPQPGNPADGDDSLQNLRTPAD